MHTIQATQHGVALNC